MTSGNQLGNDRKTIYLQSYSIERTTAAFAITRRQHLNLSSGVLINRSLNGIEYRLVEDHFWEDKNEPW